MFLVHTRLIPGNLAGNWWAASTAALICSGVASAFHFTLIMCRTVVGDWASAAVANRHKQSAVTNIFIASRLSQMEQAVGELRRIPLRSCTMRAILLPLMAIFLAGCDEMDLNIGSW